MWLKEMIARCMKRARSGACATCDHKEACAAGRWQEMFGAPPTGTAAGPGGGIGALLRDLAATVRRHTGAVAKGFRREVEDALEPLLADGQANIDRLARELGCSRQTLYRRLKAEGATFEQVLQELRQRLALRYLEGEGLGVKQTAYRLGFSDPAAFSRAFKRWTGRSPSTARA